MSETTDIPVDLFNPPDLDMVREPDGTVILTSRRQLGVYPRCLGELLIKWADKTPDRVFLAERDARGDWRRLTYADARDRVIRLSAALLERGLNRDRPVAILSGNSIGHAIMTLAAMHVGIPVAPLSPAYSLKSRDFGKLKYIVSAVSPGLIYVEQVKPFRAALAALDLKGVHLISNSDEDRQFGFEAIDDLCRQRKDVTTAVEQAFASVTPDTVAKILFTSGSTGSPKGVINTHRMLCSNQQALAQCWPFLEARPPILVDWLPWNHTFGGNHNFNLVLRNGGSLYIDQGKPVAGEIATSIRNLKSVSPTIYFNVPSGFEALLQHLEQDSELASSLFRRLDLLFYAAAALPQLSWTRLQAAAITATGRGPVICSGWGTTETSPLATTIHFRVEESKAIGVPIPGTSIKLIPVDGEAFEIRVRGPNITPGYWREPRLTEAAFDDDGYFLTQDAVKFLDPADPSAGLAFDGRLGENFKLRSGTWVKVNNLRIAAIEAAKPVIWDVVVAGEGREYVSILIFPDEEGCREIAGRDDADLPLAELIKSAKVRDWVRTRLLEHNKLFPAGSTRIRRAIILATPPDIDLGEATDKGTVSQHGILKRRSDIVERLYLDHQEIIEIKP